ncbi:Sigma_adaptin [Hexamita inflata]|uniref:Sigma adaptin n=1 Tax=Hexamita inflata TaxID=28002 RepID=A0AA86NWC3_9EUKA|nr:Sigma adaptin [Hexamita inflata]
MIHGVLIVTEQEVPILIRFYDEVDNIKQIVKQLMLYIKLRGKRVTNFIYNDFGVPYCHAVYKKFEGKYVIIISDDNESELLCLKVIDSIATSIIKIVESFDDTKLIMNIQTMHLILDNILCGGIIINYDTNRIINEFKRDTMELENKKIGRFF